MIYYPCGNVFQLFDLLHDPQEHHNLSGKPELEEKQKHLTDYLISRLHGEDLNWLRDGCLIGFDAGEYAPSPDYSLFNQRGLHWPPPSGYTSLGKT